LDEKHPDESSRYATLRPTLTGTYRSQVYSSAVCLPPEPFFTLAGNFHVVLMLLSLNPCRSAVRDPLWTIDTEDCLAVTALVRFGIWRRHHGSKQHRPAALPVTGRSWPFWGLCDSQNTLSPVSRSTGLLSPNLRGPRLPDVVPAIGCLATLPLQFVKGSRIVRDAHYLRARRTYSVGSRESPSPVNFYRSSPVPKHPKHLSSVTNRPQILVEPFKRFANCGGTGKHAVSTLIEHVFFIGGCCAEKLE
jgi:hypothetical protein